MNSEAETEERNSLLARDLCPVYGAEAISYAKQLVAAYKVEISWPHKIYTTNELIRANVVG